MLNIHTAIKVFVAIHIPESFWDVVAQTAQLSQLPVPRITDQ